MAFKAICFVVLTTSAKPLAFILHHTITLNLASFATLLRQIRLVAFACSLLTSRTTGEHRFAECCQLCRVPKIGHSAKPLFAECRTGWHSAKSSTWQRVALPSAPECPALGKSPLCRVQHSAKSGTRQKKWHLTAEPAHAVKFF